MAARLIAFLLLFVACSPSVSEQPPDHELYLAAIGGRGANVDDRFSICNQMESVSARGDCGAMVVVNAARDKHPEPGKLCEQVQKGTWRYECFFQMAEHWRRRKKMERAVVLCAKSGPFVKDCGQHMWQSEVRRLGVESKSKPLVQVMIRADTLFEHWQAFFGEGDQDDFNFPIRFWRHLFQNLVEPDVALDLALCEPLESFHLRHCRGALGALYLRRVQQVIRHSDEMKEFCAVEQDRLYEILEGRLMPTSIRAEDMHRTPKSSQATISPYTAVSDPLLLEILSRVYQHACVEKKPLPVESKWILEEHSNWVE